MCVIAVYGKGLVLDKEELRACFENNPDGAGYMVQTAKGVHIEKGFFTFNAFWNAVKNLPVDKDRVLHFRIATSGKISVNCCHPFPVTSDYKKMAMAKTDSLMGFAHNGVLQDFTPKSGMKSSKSDTMVFNHELLSKIGPSIMKNEGIQNLLELYTPSRFVVMDSTDAVMIGDWYNSPKSGAWYSNTSYQSRYYYLDDGWDDEIWEDMYFKIKDSGKYTDEDIEEFAYKVEEKTGITVYDWQHTDGDIIFTYQPGIKTLPKTGKVDGIEYKKVVIE